jgi:cell division transport system ATP-binding protein
MIVFDRVGKRYPNGREALSSVSFNIHNGEMVFLTGRSGAGKSTVLKLIALLERPSRGGILVAGKNTSTLAARHIPAFRRNIGMVFQDHKLLIADEPTGNLDPDLALEVMRLFRRFQDVGVTVVVATHDIHLVREFGQREIVLDNGKVQGDAGDALPSLMATR